MKREKAKRKTVAKLSSVKGKAAGHDDLLTDLAHLAPVRKVEEKEESLSDRIRRVRQMRGLTVKDLSSRTGLDTDTLRRTESSKLIPALGQLVRLGKALDIRMGYTSYLQK